MSSNGQDSRQHTLEDCKDYIRRLYLVQRKTQKQILEDLAATKQLHVTKSQLEYKLRKWNFRRELNQAQWWYVKRKIKHRQRQKKESEVLLSGVPIHHKTVERETTRLFLSTLDQIQGNTPRPRTPENIDLSVCTPRTSGVEQGALDALRTLPWARLQGLQVARLLYQTCHHSLEPHGESQVIWLLVLQILAKLSGSLHFAGDSRRLGRIATATQSIDRYAARLGSVIPQGPSHEHFEMLSNLRNQNSSNTQYDALRLLIFSVSNNFVMGWNNVNCLVYSSGDVPSPEDDPQEVLRLFQATALNDFSIMPRLIEATHKVPAISIFVKRLFDAAILLRCYDLAAAILHVIHKNSPWASVPSGPIWQTDHTPLAMAVRHRNIWLTSILLEAGADPNVPTFGGPTPLENAAAIDSHDTAFRLASLLISHGAAVNSQLSSSSESTSALSFAVMRGNFQLIELLVDRGAEFGQVFSRPVHPEFAENSLRPLSEIIHEISPEILAAGFCSTEEPPIHTGLGQLQREFKSVTQAPFMEDQETACQMVRYMLGQKSLSKTTSLCPEKSRVHCPMDPNTMTVAAYRGYHDVIRILHSAGASVTALNSIGASPLSAAALRGDIGTCRLLMELNDDYGDPKEFDHGPFTSSFRFPTALQISAWYDNVELCQKLLAHGADPNGPSASRVGNSCCFLIAGHGTEQYVLQHYATRHGWNCLRMALLRQSIQVAKCLLAHRYIHPPNQQDLLMTASLGDVEIMAKILKIMRSPNNMRTTRLLTIPSYALGPQRWIHFRSGNEPRDLMYSENTQGAHLNNLTALQVAAFEGHTNIVEVLLESGFEIVGPEAACAFRTGPKSLIQLILNRGPGSLYHKTLDGRSYLEMAFLGGHADLIEFALGLDLGYYDSGALCAAVIMGSEAETVRSLVKRRNYSLTDSDEEDDLLFNTALSLAASLCRRDIVKELLAVSWNVGSDCCVAPDRPIKDIYGCGTEYRIDDIHEVRLDRNWIGWHSSVFRTFSPTFLAVLGQNQEVLQDLLTAGYRTDGLTLKATLCAGISMDVGKQLVNACLNLEDGGGESYTPLQQAIVNGKIEWVRLLLQSKADPRARRKRPDRFTDDPCPKDRTAFQLAVESNVQEITDMLLDEGVSVNEPAGIVNGMTALQIAARDGLLGVAIRLKALGADVNAHRALRDGLTALEAAAANGRIDLVQYLLDSDVLTTGTGRVQYIVATKLAEYHDHSEISALLKDHRLWSVEDVGLFDKIELPYHTTCFYHSDEYTDDEREDVLQAIELLKSQREAAKNRTGDSGSETFAEGEDGDGAPIGDEAPSQSTWGLGTGVTDTSVIQSHLDCGVAELDWAQEFDDYVDLAGGSEGAFLPPPSRHTGVDEAGYVLHDEFEMAWATGVDMSLIDGFNVPFFAPEGWPFAFDEFPFPV